MANKKQTDVKSVKETTKKTVTTTNVKKTADPKKNVKTSKTEVKKIEVVEEPMDNIMEEPKKKIYVSRDTLKLIGNIVFWIIFLVLAFIWLVDFFRVSRESKPMFCIKNEVHEYKDGTVSECTGLGYKVYTYKRSSLGDGIEFGTFFAKMKQPEK